MELRSPSDCAHVAHADGGQLLCTDCGTLREAAPAPTYFELYGLADSPFFDPAGLHARYLKLSRQVHPDRFARQAPEMRARAEAWSSLVNRAYETLRDPEDAIRYFLTMHGAAPESGSGAPPLELAEAFFELDDLSPSAHPEAWDRFRTMLDAHAERIEAERQSLASQTGAPDFLIRLKNYLQQRRFLTTLRAHFEERKQAHGSRRD